MSFGYRVVVVAMQNALDSSFWNKDPNSVYYVLCLADLSNIKFQFRIYGNFFCRLTYYI